MPSRNILVVGSANMDMVMRVQRLPKPGETLMAHEFMTAHGGKGANQAVAAARLGGCVSFIGTVGKDAFGSMQREGLAAEGIDVTHLAVDPEQPTGVAQILIGDSGHNMIVVAPSANHSLTPGDLERLRPAFASAEVVITQLEIPLDTVEAALHLARASGAISILDVGSAIPLPEAIVTAADIISPNETEAEALTGIEVNSTETAEAAAEQLRTMGAAHVVMKLGSRGCLYLGDGQHHLPAFSVTALDSTAAGDAFTAALGVAWGRVSLDAALQFANAAGALAATVAGAQPSMPTLSAVRAFLNERGVLLPPVLQGEP